MMHSASWRATFALAPILCCLSTNDTFAQSNAIKNGDFSAGANFWTLREVKGWDTGGDPPHYPVMGIKDGHFCPEGYSYSNHLYFDVPWNKDHESEAYAEQSVKVPKRGAQLSMLVFGNYDPVTAIVSVIDGNGTEHIIDTFIPILTEQQGGGCSGEEPETRKYDLSAFESETVTIRLTAQSRQNSSVGTFATFDDLELIPTTPYVVNWDTDVGDFDLEDEKCDAEPATTAEECTLRAAIENANEVPAPINFDKDKIQTIYLTESLPWVSEAYAIDGTTVTEPGYVVIDGSNAEDTGHGLVVNIRDVTLKGLTIRKFNIGIAALLADNLRLDDVRVSNNDTLGLFISESDEVRFTRGSASNNGKMGILIEDSKNTQIGGDDIDLGVSVESNKGIGILVRGENSEHVEILNNKVLSNDSTGILVKDGFHLRVYGNSIGGNQYDGIRLINALDSRIGDVGAESNTIFTNVGNGIRLDGGTSGTRIFANQIAENMGHGIEIDSSFTNFIGEAAADHWNKITENIGNGITLTGNGTTRNTIIGNAIYGNGGIAIDLGNDGPTPNDLSRRATLDDADADEGPNELQNFPAGVHWGFHKDRNAFIVTGFLDSPEPQHALITMYGSKSIHVSGRGEAEHLLGSANPDLNGFFWKVFPGSTLAEWPIVSATATNFDGSTSEVSMPCGTAEANVADTDDDGLCDNWESPDGGIDYDGDGEIDLNLAELGASPDRPDVFVEYDWMRSPAHNHKPQPGAPIVVSQIFAQSSENIDLHFEAGEEMPEIPSVRFDLSEDAEVPYQAEFAEIKWGKNRDSCSNDGNDHGFFGSASDRSDENCPAILGAKKLVYRYMLAGHQNASAADALGQARFHGSDIFLSTGGMYDTGEWTYEEAVRTLAGFCIAGCTQVPIELAERIAGAFLIMHELGHSLNLHHGGADDINCKPNHLSVMNYALSDRSLVASAALDYSRYELPTLDEKSLNENAGIGGPSSLWTVINQTNGTEIGTYDFNTADQIFDFDGIDSNSDGDDFNDPEAKANISRVQGYRDCDLPDMDRLVTQNDWKNLALNFRTVPGVSGQLGGTTSDRIPKTTEEIIKAAETTDFDGDGFPNSEDNCSAYANADQVDADNDGIGDACEVDQSDLGLIIESGRSVPEATTYTTPIRLVISNDGPADATDVVIQDSLHGDYQTASIDEGSGECTLGQGYLGCLFSGLAAGDTAIVTVAFVADESVVIGNKASVSSSQVDPDLSDNTAASSISVLTEEVVELPDVFRLYDNYPNPFAGKTTIRFDVPETASVRITVHDVLGRLVSRIVDREFSAGRHSVLWAPDLVSGVYYITLKSGAFSETKSINLVH